MRKYPDRPSAVNDSPATDAAREPGSEVAGIAQNPTFMDGYLEWLKEILLNAGNPRRLPEDSDVKTDIAAYKRHLESLENKPKETSGKTNPYRTIDAEGLPSAEEDRLSILDREHIEASDKLGHRLASVVEEVRQKKYMDHAKREALTRSSFMHTVERIMTAIREGTEVDYSNLPPDPELENLFRDVERIQKERLRLIAER